MYFKKQKNELFLIYKRIRSIFLIKIILFLFSIFYFCGYKIRLFLYKTGILKTNKLSIKVISIGNLTSGGTGKTPLSIEIANYLIKNENKVAVLSRGYKRRLREESNGNNILVSDGQEILSDYERSGDEPYLIAKNVPKAIVISGTDRVLNAKSAIKLGADILILDDGFQYLKLQRDENILIIDSMNPFDNGLLLPAGELRELPDSIKRATAIVLSNTQNIKPTDTLFNLIKKHSPNKPIIEINYTIKSLKGINIVKTLNINELTDKNIIAFSGIGNPESFEKSLTNIGFKITKHLVYPDHHNYEFDDITKIIEYAVKNKIENIITTEKDAIKIGLFIEGAPVTFWHTVLEIKWETSDPFSQLLSNIKS